MIDMHTHTAYSDGTWTTEKVLAEAERTGITILSITDHNTINAYREIEQINAKKIYTGKIIQGEEFDIMFHGAKLELLGYGFDLEKIQYFNQNNYEKNKIDLNKEFKLMYDACKENNIKIEEGLKYDSKLGKYPRFTIYQSIKKYEENKEKFTQEQWNNIDMLFRACTCQPDFPLYIDFSRITPSAKSVSNAIREAGGKVFIAHIFSYGLKDPIEYLDYLREENIIDGVEVYHSYFTEEQSEFLKDYCKKYNLLMSGGSDCHGDKKKDRKIGVGYNNLNISETLIKEWT